MLYNTESLFALIELKRRGHDLPLTVLIIEMLSAGSDDKLKLIFVVKMPGCQGRPCSPDRQICHCTGWPSQWHSDELWDRRPGCRGAWIGCRHATFSILYQVSSLLFLLHVSSFHFWSVGVGTDISSPVSTMHQTLSFCDAGAWKRSCFDVH